MDDDDAVACVSSSPAVDAYSYSVSSVSWVPDDPYRCIACYAADTSGGAQTAGGQVNCLDLRRPERPLCLTPPAPSFGHSWTSAPLWSRTDGENVVVAWGNALRVFNLDVVADSVGENASFLNIFEDQTHDFVTACDISADGQKVFYGTNGGFVGALAL